MDAIRRTLLIEREAGMVGLFVDAKDAPARSFYEQYGFVFLREGAGQLFLPLATLRAAQSSQSKKSTITQP